MLRFFVSCLMLAASTCAYAASPSAKPDAMKAFSALPVWFEPNAGQFASSVKFFSRGGSGTLLVGQDQVTLLSGKSRLGVAFRGARRATLEGLEAKTSRSSYMIGNDRQNWKHDIQHFTRVRGRQLYPGIDVVYYLADRELEFDLEVAPGADPEAIRLAFEGAGKPRLDSNGDLIFGSQMRQRRPVAYQMTSAGRTTVDASYRIAKNGEVTLALSRYDKSKPLVIDPVLQAAYLGGDRQERAQDIVLDQQGNVWITGSSASVVSIPGQIEPIQDSIRGGRDIFLAKMTRDASGRLSLAYWTQLGGSSDDEATAIAADNGGFLYLTGTTSSSDFPQAGAALQDAFGGEVDAFVAVIHPSDSGQAALWYSQYYGGPGTDVSNAIAVESTSVLYIGGYTTSDKLPGVGDGQLQCCRRGGYEAFLVRVEPYSSAPRGYATFFGGGSTDVIKALAADGQGGVYLAGYTLSPEFPVTFDAYQTDFHTAFLGRIDTRRPGLDALTYATYIGGSSFESAEAIVVDREGSIWLSGYTFSFDFPTTGNAYRTTSAGLADLFLVRFDYSKRTTSEAIAYSTYLGGRDGEMVYGMSLVPGGGVALTGYTYSDDFPMSDVPQPVRSNSPGAFIAVLNPSRSGGEALSYSQVIGGSFIDAATGVAADSAGNLLVCGFTYSFDFPVTDDSTKRTPGGMTQSFVLTAAPGRR